MSREGYMHLKGHSTSLHVTYFSKVPKKICLGKTIPVRWCYFAVQFTKSSHTQAQGFNIWQGLGTPRTGSGSGKPRFNGIQPPASHSNGSTFCTDIVIINSVKYRILYSHYQKAITRLIHSSIIKHFSPDFHHPSRASPRKQCFGRTRHFCLIDPSSGTSTLQQTT